MSFGIYREGDSLAHRLDPRAKIVFVLLYIVAAFLVQSAPGLAVAALVAIGVLVASGTGPRGAAAALRPFAWLMLFVLVFDVLFVNEGQVLAQAGPICISVSGIQFALKAVVRFACVLLGTSTLMTTTSPTSLADGAALLLAPLQKLGVNTNNAAMVLGMTLRFIPVVSEEMARVREAQELRYANFTGGVIARLRAYVPVIIPLFQGAMRRAETLALAMENREYDPQGTRTCIRSYRLTRADVAVLALGCVLVALAVVDLVLL